jgi:hypothetical protein
MKKLLVLLMVLGLVSSAQAALSLSLSATTVLTGGTVTVTISQDNQAFWDGYIILSEDTYNWADPTLASWNDSIVTGGIGNLGFINPVSGYPGVYGTNVASNQVPNDVVAGDMFTISILAGTTAGTTYLAVEDGSYNYLISDVALQIVPEPMTIALLGLGGLFLRRRK